MSSAVDSSDIRSALDDVEGEEGQQPAPDNPEADGQPSEPNGEGQDQTGQGQRNGEGPSGDTSDQSDVPPKLRDKSADELREMYVNLEDKLGEQGQQMSEMREQLAELRGRMQGAEQPEEEPDEPQEEVPQVTAEDLPDDVMDMEPEQIAQFVDQAAQAKATSIVDEKIDEFRDQELAPVQQREQLREAQTVVEEAASGKDDFAEHKEDISEILEQDHIQKAIQEADRDGKVEIVELAYQKVAGGQSNQPSSQQTKGSKTNGSPSQPEPSGGDQDVSEKVQQTLDENINPDQSENWDV